MLKWFFQVVAQWKGISLHKPFLGTLPFPKIKNCIKKTPVYLLDPLKYLPLNYQQNILEKMESFGSAAAVVSWKSKVFGLTMGRKSTYSPFQEDNQPNVAVILFCCTPIHIIIPNTQSSCSSWMGTENLHCLCNLLMDTEAVTFGPYTLKQRFIFRFQDKVYYTEICHKNSSWNK